LLFISELAARTPYSLWQQHALTTAEEDVANEMIVGVGKLRSPWYMQYA
jgi:hypothetical protein